jgi:hypothetical protein
MKLFILLLAVVALSRADDYLYNNLWPLPNNLNYTLTGDNVTISPCNLKYVVEAPGQAFVEDMIKLYLTDVFKCKIIKEGSVIVNVVVSNTNQLVPTDVLHEKYSIFIRNNSRWELSADYYPGFLRGLETFSQLFEKN